MLLHNSLPHTFLHGKQIKMYTQLEKKKKYSFATIFRFHISFNVIEAILSESLLIVCISLRFTVSYRVE